MQHFKQLLLLFWESYKIFAVAFVTIVFMLMLIFGGSWSIKINFNSWNELMKTLKK